MTVTSRLAPRVVVGVSNSASGQAALRRGVREARDRGAALHLVRAWRDVDRLFSMTAAEVRDLPAAQSREAAVLSDAYREARRLDRTLRIQADLVAADVYPALSKAAQAAAVLVMGAGSAAAHSSHLGEWFQQHASCPVVIVPAAAGTPSAPADTGADARA